MTHPRSLNERAAGQSNSRLLGASTGSWICMSEFVHVRPSPLSHAWTLRLSTSLFRVIFESPQVHDATSLMTILQVDLSVLENWGYPGASATTFCLLQVADLIVIHQPVERILRKKADREAAEKAKADAERKAAKSALAEAKREAPVEKAIAEKGASLNSSTLEIAVQETQAEPKISLLDTSIPAPLSQATPKNTGSKQIPKPSYSFERHRPPNRSDAFSSRRTFPLKGKDKQPQLKSVLPLPRTNIPTRGRLLPKPGASLNGITPLSKIGISS